MSSTCRVTPILRETQGKIPRKNNDVIDDVIVDDVIDVIDDVPDLL